MGASTLASARRQEENWRDGFGASSPRRPLDAAAAEGADPTVTTRTETAGRRRPFPRRRRLGWPVGGGAVSWRPPGSNPTFRRSSTGRIARTTGPSRSLGVRPPRERKAPRTRILAATVRRSASPGEPRPGVEQLDSLVRERRRGRPGGGRGDASRTDLMQARIFVKPRRLPRDAPAAEGARGLALQPVSHSANSGRRGAPSRRRKVASTAASSLEAPPRRTFTIARSCAKARSRSSLITT